ncbi:MAG: hormogonium polysaccharide biosynthesis glycosyltransferase HpsE [Cyanobacteria bacterium J06554_11]
MDFTVAIPTYNGAERLPQLLENLRSQTGTDHFSWTVLVVDNNSADNTAEVVKHYQSQWSEQSNNASSLEYVFEAEQGIAYARLRAISSAKSKWVGFIDDDIVPTADWVTQAYDFGESHPKAGAYGGRIHGDFEVAPPENFDRIQSFLALRERGPTAHQYDPDNLSLPSAAAWVVRKQAWDENAPENPKLVGRVTKAMVAGDDYEVLLHIHRAGWEIWYDPDMKAAHQIPEKRLERSYLTRLSRGCGLCICQLRMINTDTWKKPLVFIKLILSNFRRVVLHWLKYRRQIQTDLVTACEMEFFLGSFVSPFYYLQTLLFPQK